MAQDKYYFKESSSLESFPSSTLKQIISDYESNELSIAEIKKKYEGITSMSFIRQVPYVLSDEACELCDTLIYHKNEKLGYSNYKLLKLCLSCKHDYSTKCSCDICTEKRKKEEKIIEQDASFFWKEYYKENYQISFSYDDLSVFDIIKLLVLVESTDDNTDCLKFEDQYKLNIEVTSYILKLINKGILIPSKNNFSPKRINYIYNLEENFIHIDWILNIKKEGADLLRVDEFYKLISSRVFSTEEKQALWHEVYTSQVKAFIDAQTELALKTKIKAQVLDALIDDIAEFYSLSKAFSLVYLATSSALQIIQQDSFNKKELNERFISRLSKLVQDYKTKITTLKDFYPAPDIPLSKFNEYVISNVLKIEKSYFYLTKLYQSKSVSK